MPVVLRAYLLSNVNMCWLLGQITGVSVIRAFAEYSSQWSYRIPFALQWAFAIPILVGVFFAPESPCTFGLAFERRCRLTRSNRVVDPS